MKRLFKQFQGALLSLIFLGYLVSSFAFAHAHIVDGVRIVHSHPYDNDHQEHGTHSESEMLLFNILAESFVVDVPEIIQLQIPFCLVHISYYIPCSHELISKDQLTISSRGPPYLS